MAKVFLSAEWKNLIMANYTVEPSILKQYLPAGTQLDFYNGRTYVSLVGFMFLNTRVKGIKIPFHINFEEVNLRFYVKRFVNGEWRRGVVFIKEIVPKLAISFVANTVYKEKYCRMPMQHSIKLQGHEMKTEYRWKHSGKWNRLGAVTNAAPENLVTGSEAAFIAEHYFGYSRYNNTTTYEYEVKHPEWKIHLLKSYNADCDFKTVYGDAFAILNNRNPDSVFMAAGSAITVSGKQKIQIYS